MPYFEVQLTRKLQRLYPLHADMVIGRAPQCEIQILSRAVSRRHARIEFDGTQAIISDLGTKNGITLNGQRVEGAAVVQEGDQVIVGDIKMIYRTADRSIVSSEAIDLRLRPANQQDVQASLAPKSSFLLRAEQNCINSFQALIGRVRIANLEFDEVTQFKLQIALKEAVENARVHGCGGDPNRHIQVTFTEDEDEFVMAITDEGQGYNVESVLADATEVEPLEAVRNRDPALGPLGLRIILGCVDRIQFGGQGSTVYLGRFKAAGELLIISEEEVVAGGEPSGEAWINPGASPFADGDSDEGPIDLGDSFSGRK